MMHQFNDDVLDVSKQLVLKKAEDVCALHVSQLTIVADYFILSSGRSDVHVRSLCDDVEKLMMEKGKQRLRIEGYREGRWIVLDYGDILIHVFHKQERAFYDLERLWVDGDNCLKITDEDIRPKE